MSVVLPIWTVGNLTYKKTLLCLHGKGARANARCAALQTAGYKVIAVHDVAEALKVFVSQTVDAVLLDSSFGTGKKDSPGVLMTSIRPHVPIVVMRGERAYIPNGIFAQIFRKRDGNRALLRIVETVVGPGSPKQTAKSAGR